MLLEMSRITPFLRFTVMPLGKSGKPHFSQIYSNALGKRYECDPSSLFIRSPLGKGLNIRRIFQNALSSTFTVMPMGKAWLPFFFPLLTNALGKSMNPTLLPNLHKCPRERHEFDLFYKYTFCPWEGMTITLLPNLH